jgi:queuine/archaeosine tRNA-ribosyltransferase
MIGKRMLEAKRIARQHKKLILNAWCWDELGRDWLETEGVEQKFRKTKKACSCYMCGNFRKHWGEVTLQEKKAEEDFNQQLREVGMAA